MKWCNIFMMWCDDIDTDDVYDLCDGDCCCCDEMEELKGGRNEV